MATECTASKLEFHGLGRRDVVGVFDGGEITSDAGGVALRDPSRSMARLGLYDTARTLEFTADNANLFINQFGALASLAGKRHFDSVTLDVFLSEAEQEAKEAAKRQEQEARRQLELEAAENRQQQRDAQMKRYEEAEQTLRDTQERLREALKRCDPLTEYEQGWSYWAHARGLGMNWSVDMLIEKAEEFESIIDKTALCKGSKEDASDFFRFPGSEPDS